MGLRGQLRSCSSSTGSGRRRTASRILLGVGFALSPLPAVLLDDGLIIVAANRAAELTFGSGPQSLLGRRIADLSASPELTRSSPVEAASLGVRRPPGAGARARRRIRRSVIATLKADAVCTRSGRRYTLVQIREVTALRADPAGIGGQRAPLSATREQPARRLGVHFRPGPAAAERLRRGDPSQRLQPSCHGRQSCCPTSCRPIPLRSWRIAFAGRWPAGIRISSTSARSTAGGSGSGSGRSPTPPESVVGGLSLNEDVTDDRAQAVPAGADSSAQPARELLVRPAFAVGLRRRTAQPVGARFGRRASPCSPPT